MPIINRIAEFQDDMTAWRRYLHTIPELQFDTIKTAAFVVEKLREFGVDHIEEGIGRTGVVAVINGNGKPGKAIGLRADMDALPIAEETGLDYASQTPGQMHACGHDGHTTMLLGAARYLAETRNFAGKAVLIFQPAEEGGGGGREMCADGMMDKFGIDEVYGIHTWPTAEFGTWNTRAGPLMAATDTFTITITGRGAHAAKPHEAIDPVPIAAYITTALQSIVSRVTEPSENLVVSVTQIHAGTVSNVIPQTAMLNGTVRTLTEGLNDIVKEQIARIAEHTAAAHGATAEFEYVLGYPVTSNTPEKVAFAQSAASQVVDPSMVDTEYPSTMGAEDFSYMLQERPGNYAFLGQGIGPGLHHPKFNFNDEIAPIGASYFVKLVESAST